MRTIYLLGRSLLLSLVAANLKENANLHIVLADSWGEFKDQPPGIVPDVLIYDLGGASDSRILPMMFDNPCLQMIGLDVETNRAVLITGRETRSLTLDRVKELVDGKQL
jgi:hypothetical protein